MIRRIVTDTAFLSQRSEPAAPFDRTVANMVGANKRVIAVSDEGRLQVFYNPEITRRSRPYEAEEGCLSLPGTRRVTRYACIRLHWQDEQGTPHEQAFLGLTAQIIQHECDHCEGILV